MAIHHPGEDNALIHSAAIGANVIEVLSIEARSGDIVLIGQLPSPALTEGRGSRPGRIEVQVHEVNAFYGIHGDTGRLGFLIVQPPIRLTSGALPDDDIALVALRIPVPEALRLDIPINEQGPVCCRMCNIVIPTGRLKAVKNARFCVKCKQIEENSHR